LETNSAKYGKYIVEHCNNVKRAFEEYGDELCAVLNVNKSDLSYNVNCHDTSKYSAEEFTGYKQYFYPEDGAEKNKKKFDEAWLHHENTNPHHPEYWIMRDDNEIKTLDMPPLYIAEMLLDWQAMSYKFDSSIVDYYNTQGKNKPFSPTTSAEVKRAIDKVFNK